MKKFYGIFVVLLFVLFFILLQNCLGGNVDCFEESEEKFWFEQEKLLASDGITGDSFGKSLFFDGNNLLVGAPGDDDHGQMSGSAYFFNYDENRWIQNQKICPLDGDKNDNFGTSVCIRGNISIIGAPGDNTKGTWSGAAYIFERTEGTWKQKVKLTAEKGTEFDFFGLSVSINQNTAIIGAPGNDKFGNAAGCVYVFEKKNDVWTQTMNVYGSKAVSGQSFGTDIALDGERFVVGAPSDKNQDYPGLVYVFQKGLQSSFSEQIEWREIARIHPLHIKYDDNFGKTVAFCDENLVVGAPADDEKNAFSGSVYFFEYTRGRWLQKDRLLPFESDPYQRFGDEVFIHKNSLLVSTRNTNVFDSNYVNLYTKENSEWKFEHTFQAENITRVKDFGCSCSVRNDTVIIGASGDNDQGNNSGSVFLFSQMKDNDPPVLRFNAPSDSLYFFGYEVQSLETSLIFGSISINATAVDSLSGIRDLRIFIDGYEQYKTNSSAIDWKWNDTVFGKKVVEIVASDNVGNQVSERKIVWKFF